MRTFSFSRYSAASRFPRPWLGVSRHGKWTTWHNQSSYVESEGLKAAGVERSNTTVFNAGGNRTAVESKPDSPKEYSARQTVGLSRSKTQITPTKVSLTDPAGGQNHRTLRRLSTMGGGTSPILSPSGNFSFYFT